RHRHAAARADDEGDGGAPDLEDPDGASRPARGSRGPGGVARLRRVLVLDGRGLRPVRRSRDLLALSSRPGCAHVALVLTPPPARRTSMEWAVSSATSRRKTVSTT